MMAMALLANITNLRSYREAHTFGQWEHRKIAMDNGLSKMNKHQVFKITPRLPSMHVLKARWVYTRKIDGITVKVVAYKASWVAKGYAQIKGLHFNDIYASVVHKDLMRIFLSLVNSLDMECDQVNIKADISLGEVEQTIFMEPPEGSDISHSKVNRLRKCLCGLCQSHHCLNQSFDKSMRSEGFTPTQADPCLYIYKQDKVSMLVPLHVDDQLIACNAGLFLVLLRSGSMHSLSVQNNGPINDFLNFNVIYDRQARRQDIAQKHYMKALLERFDRTNCNPVRTPLLASFKSVSATDEESAPQRTCTSLD
jgi:hypothetical protein